MNSSQRRRRAPGVWLSMSTLLVVTAASAAAGLGVRAAADTTQPWLAPGLSVTQRVDLLLNAMTLTDKIAELHADACPPYEACVPANPAYGLPEMVLEDDSTGVAAGMQGVTALPATIAASASFDPSLMNSYGQVIGAEEKAKGVDVALAPTVNIARNPQWGRNFESLGEDPYLSGQMAAADVQGIQSQGILADVKHFAVYDQETDRKTVSANVSTRAMQEIYFPAFHAAITAGAGSIMSSYNEINGISASQNPYLLTNVLRDEFGFNGFIRSDGGGTYSTVPAANAGLDMQVKGTTDYFAAPLLAAVQDGQVTMAQLNSMLTPILADMFQYNLVGGAWGAGTTTENVITPQDTQTALNVAEQGSVLLKNQSSTLPLSASAKSIAVVGPDASPGMAEGGGSGDVVTPFLVSPAQGIQAADQSATVTTAPGVVDPTAMTAIPAADLSPAYAPSKTGYTGTLTPTESGDFTIAVQDATPYNAMTLSINGTEVLTAAGTPGHQYGTGTVSLQAGKTYQVQITGPSAAIAWATPEQRQAAIAQAVSAASQAQVAVVVVGDDESEAMDRVGLDLGEDQDNLISAVAAANPNTIVVLDSGSAVLMPWLDQVKSVLEAWYPGEQDGTALAALLFGQVDPSGKLPMTFPASQSQVPASTPQQFPGQNGVANFSEDIDVGYRWYDQNDQTPLFPFGFGLSYTTFQYSDLSINPGLTTAVGSVKVSVTVTNTGQTAGSDVAQLYLGDPASTGEPPRQLKGFQKVTLSPGQSTRVTFTLAPSDLSYWNSTSNEFQVDEGTYNVYVGDASDLADLPMTGDFHIIGTTGPRATTLHAPTQVTAGQPMTVTATYSPGGDLPLAGVNFNLQAPDGWTVTPQSPTVQPFLQPDQAFTVTWQVTPPADEPTNVDLLTATASYSSIGDVWPQATQVGRAQVSVVPPTG